MSDTRFLVAGIDGEICWKQFGPVAYISWIAVKETSKGHGTILLKAFEEYVAEVGCTRVECINVISRLELDGEILRRFQFFQKNGYNFVGIEQFDLASEGPVVHMKRQKIIV
jgi:GNAT superfamily N-acetyltransferase